MKLTRIASFVLWLFLVDISFRTPAYAEEHDKKTLVTFSQRIEIPGRLLPPETYVFKLLDSAGYRHIVQVWNERETILLETVLAIPNYRVMSSPQAGPTVSVNAATPQSVPQSQTAAGDFDQSETTFRALSELVTLPVSVTDKDGNFVSGLRSSDFKVYEGGQLQKITVFKPEDVPVTVGLIVDHSGSMQPKLASVSAAISSFAHSSNLDDEMFVVDFNDRVWPEVFGGKLFTSNVTELEGALMSVAAQGQTALYDAIHEGLQRMRFAHRDKKALIVVSDGGDNSSRRKYSEVLALARQSQTIIYAIGLVGATGQEENPRALERLSKDTGGLAFFPRTLDTVTKISNRIASDLREQYTIGYVPPKKEGDGRFRKVQVNVSSPGQGKLHVRTRTGYSMVQDRPSQAVSRPQP